MATKKTPLNESEAEFLRRYDIHAFDLPLTTVDVATFTLIENDLHVLLVQRGAHPYKNKWSLPGGFIDLKHDSSLEDTAVRKLKEKTGVNTPYVEQVCSVGGVDRDPRGWSATVLYMALIRNAPTADFIDAVVDARWWPWREVAYQELAFDHYELLVLARERLRTKTAYTALPIHVLEPPFTLTQLQQAFEVLMDAPLEKKSFRRRILASDVLREAGESSGARGRPAAVYRPKAGFSDYLFARVIGED